MSDANSHDDTPHEGPIKTPKQLIATVVASFVVPIIVIILLVNFIAAGDKPAAGSDGLGPEAVAQRLQRVGTVTLKEAGGAAVVRTGEEVYKAACTACHSIGAAGAPKTGDTGAWAARIATGFDALYASAMKGKGAMPAQGGGDYSDYEIARAVVYLANQGGGKFEEPAPPAAPASAAN